MEFCYPRIPEQYPQLIALKIINKTALPKRWLDYTALTKESKITLQDFFLRSHVRVRQRPHFFSFLYCFFLRNGRLIS
jgi:hypothetical protein